MSDRKDELLKALKCCKVQHQCDQCPLQEEICDELFLEMIKLPEELVEMVIDELEEMTL